MEITQEWLYLSLIHIYAVHTQPTKEGTVEQSLLKLVAELLSGVNGEENSFCRRVNKLEALGSLGKRRAEPVLGILWIQQRKNPLLIQCFAPLDLIERFEIERSCFRGL